MVASRSNGNTLSVYVADENSNLIRKITVGGTVKTLAVKPGKGTFRIKKQLK